jgi:hypothetical protein
MLPKQESYIDKIPMVEQEKDFDGETRGECAIFLMAKVSIN